MNRPPTLPLISVAIPAYNAADTIADALYSLQRQTYPYWEAIVVDDGSTDVTASVATWFDLRDPRIRLISQSNQGVSAARNAAISRARYPWLLFLDADDWLERRALEHLMTALQQDESADAAYGGWRYVTSDGHGVFGATPRESGRLFKHHLRSCPFAIHSCLIRKDFVEHVGGCDTSLTTCEDWDLWQRVARAGARFRAVPHLVALYRMRPSSASMNGARMLTDGLRVLARAYEPDRRVSLVTSPGGASSSEPGAAGRGVHMSDLDDRRHYFLCSTAGLACGSGEEAAGLIELVPGAGPWLRVDPHYAAACFVQSALTAAGRPLSEWDAAWCEIKPHAARFFEALEDRLAAPGFAAEALEDARLIVPTYMKQLGGAAKRRALWCRTRLRGRRARLRLGSMLDAVRGTLGSTLRTALHLSPTAASWIRRIRRPLTAPDSREAFESLFSEAEDPWNFTNAYERWKYTQTLDVIPDVSIESALELSCAEGQFTEQLAPRVKRLLATDVSQVAVERTARRCRDFPHVSYGRLDFVKDAIPGSYDLIVCSESLYYAGSRDDLCKVARKITGALNPGGHLVMAHANVVVDEPDAAGFGWDHEFGARVIGETFAAIDSLRFLTELQTPLYRIQLFQREATSGTGRLRRRMAARRTRDAAKGIPVGWTRAEATDGALGSTNGRARINGASEGSLGLDARRPRIIPARMTRDLPEHVGRQVFWHGMTTRLPILTYHRVAPTGSDALARWRVRPDQFEAQLQLLRERGYYGATFEQWHGWTRHGAPLPKGAVLMTFDDGYADFAEYAWPLLKKYGFPAVLFAVSGEVGGSNRWDHRFGEKLELLTWLQLRELAADGLTIGAHSRTHASLTGATFRLKVDELARAKFELEQGLGHRIRSVAYPYGASSPLVHFLAGACGYDFGVTTRPGFASRAHSSLALPRFEVEGHFTLDDFARMLGIAQTESALATAA